MEVLFEDSDLLIINKPAGTVVNRADTVNAPTIQEWMEERLAADKSTASDWQALLPSSFTEEFGTPEEVFKERGGVVHRLDKDTSGALVLAKNPGSLINLLAQFKQRTVHKTYTCLVHGKLRFEKGTVSVPLGRASGNRKKFAVVADGRTAETNYQVEAFYPHLNVEKIIQDNKASQSEVTNFKKKAKIYQGFSLITCWPKTGRTHQIRVHMKHLGHPIVGDVTYLGHKRASLDPVWCSRQFLHASLVTVAQPRTSEPIEVTAPLTADLQQVLELVTIE
ncbi:MAG TPA: RluA family pseudouridine synthase [Patescibacteria group bacterium]